MSKIKDLLINILNLEKMNAIRVIHPYKDHGIWVFDDDRVGLIKEPFVAGADIMLDIVTGNADKCSLMFSPNEFPDAEHKVKIIGPGVGGGTDYMFEGKIDGATIKHKLWLCPALFKYFEEAPETIYFKAI